MYARDNYNNNFNDDLKRANELEERLKLTFEQNWNCTGTLSRDLYNGSFSDWDVKIEFKDDNEDITIELKEDKKAWLTKNVAIEFGRVVNGEWRDSSLSLTKANIWCQYIGDTFYLIEVNKLKDLIQNGSYKVVEGGDGERSRMYLIPLKEFMKYATPLK